MSAESPRLLDIARRVSEGQEVDWDRYETTAAPAGEDALVRSMREVARIVDAHRDQQERGVAGAEPVAAQPHAADPPAPGHQATAPPAPKTWGGLEILDRVGAGAFGEVFRARDPKLDRVVALKLLRPTATARAGEVLREGRLLARVHHPNVMTVFGADEHDGRVGIWMEFVRGRTLAHRLRHQGTLGAQEAGHVGLDLCRALAALHAAGLVHRDIKAQNVMREEGGRIVLMDLGAGADTTEDLFGPSLRMTGTPVYMAPELFRGIPASPQSDIYSLGVLLYYLVSCAFPVDAESLAELQAKHAGGDTRPLGELRPDLSPAFVRVVDRALSLDSRERYASAAAMAQALASALGVESGPAAARSLGWRTATVVGVTAAIVIGLVLAWRWRAGDGAAPGATTQIGSARVVAPAREVVPGPAGAGPVSEATNAGAAAAYTIEAAFYRGTGLRERIGPGVGVRVGDALSLDIEVSRDVYLYVLDEDDAGEAVLLFPLPGDDPARPLRGGVRHVVPGERDGRPRYWQVTSAGGREHLLVVASPERLSALERDTRSFVRPESDRPLQYARLSEAARAELRGIAGIMPGPAPSSAPHARLYETAPRLGAGIETGRGAWIRRLDVENREDTPGEIRSPGRD